MEGTLCTGGTSGCPSGVPACNAPGLTLPILEYSHSSGDCSVTGGYVYRGRLYPRFTGTYFYGDYCTGKVWGATRTGGALDDPALRAARLEPDDVRRGRGGGALPRDRSGRARARRGFEPDGADGDGHGAGVGQRAGR